jgi:phospholipase/carboxylesterase
VPIVPIGFSQGGLMASQLLRTRPERVAATVVLGGFVLGHPQPSDEALSLARPPVFWGRGANDRVIADSAISRTAAFLGTYSSLDRRPRRSHRPMTGARGPANETATQGS